VTNLERTHRVRPAGRRYERTLTLLSLPREVDAHSRQRTAPFAEKVRQALTDPAHLRE
jgi:hypothetical protein